MFAQALHPIRNLKIAAYTVRFDPFVRLVIVYAGLVICLNSNGV